MQEAIAKANTLIEAMGWIRRFRGKTTIIKLGGSVLDDAAVLDHILLDIIFMETVGMRPVLIHGGGKAINRALEKEGIQPRFLHGRRVTDEETLRVVRRVLVGGLNTHLTSRIEELGGRAGNMSLDTTCVLRGEPIFDTVEGDLGSVGKITSVLYEQIESLSHRDIVPVIPSICFDADDNALNVNADDVALAVAESLNAEKLVFLSDVPGVLANVDDPDSLINSLSSSQARQLIQDGTINGGMIPKVQACLHTLDRGVQKVHIVDGRLRHSLLLEIYTTSGVGTAISADAGSSFAP